MRYVCTISAFDDIIGFYSLLGFYKIALQLLCLCEGIPSVKGSAESGKGYLVSRILIIEFGQGTLLRNDSPKI